MIKKLIRNLLLPIYKFLLNKIQEHKNRVEVETLKKIKITNLIPIVYYLGTTNHNNLGDNAQFYCIRKWIKENYVDNFVFEFSAPAIVSKKSGFIDIFKNKYRPQDIIIFQSGYTTQDLGGQHEEMHRLIIDNIPYAKILMMPQTIFFKKEENKNRCSQSYNKAYNMLFLARDSVSFKIAKEMFPNITVKQFPDIVTTLIGEYFFQNKRDGVLICRRNDGEKFYSEGVLLQLKNNIETELNENVTISDTTIDISTKRLHANLKGYIENELEKYSKYKVIITDRYHGTIFSLISNTPVVVIKTNDHKVITGLDWFKNVYDCAYYAKNIQEAFVLTKKIINSQQVNKLKPYFKEKYYDKLKLIFNSIQNK